MRRFTSLVVITLIASACAGQVPELERTTTTTVAPAPTSTEGPITTTTQPVITEPPVVPAELADFGVMPLSIQDGELTYLLTVAVADSAAERAQGLMGLVDLGDLDGMLFIWPDLTDGTFWMKDTLIPLDIAFFGPSGSWVNNFTMQPCLDDECESYSAGGPYLYAIEVPDAGFAALTSAAQLNLDL